MLYVQTGETAKNAQIAEGFRPAGPVMIRLMTARGSGERFRG